MSRFCSPLELIAFAIHPGDTQSTSTVGWEPGSNTLFVTAQGNSSFGAVNLAKVHEMIDFLTTASDLHRAGRAGKDDCKSHYWETHCALLRKDQTAQGIAKLKLDALFNSVYDRCWERFLALQFTVDELQQTLKQNIQAIVVVLDKQIFGSRVPEKTGFHGESRILRHLFIRDYPAIHLNMTGGGFAFGSKGELSEDQKRSAYLWFKAHMATLPLAMGSSQGTCKKCAACLDDYGVAHGEPENEPGQWLDPLTLCGNQGTTTILKPDYWHALHPAFHTTQ